MEKILTLEFTDKDNNYYYLAKAWHIQKQCNVMDIHKTTADGKKISKLIKVVNDNSNVYTYQIEKTQVKAIRGINGLFEHFKNCLDFGFGVDCWVVEPINRMLENVKEAI